MDTKDYAMMIDLGIHMMNDTAAVKHSLDLQPEDYLPAAKAAYSVLVPASNSYDFGMQAYQLFGELVLGQSDRDFFVQLADHFERHITQGARSGLRFSPNAVDAIRDTMLLGRCPTDMYDRFFSLLERTEGLVRPNPPVRAAAPQAPTC